MYSRVGSTAFATDVRSRLSLCASIDFNEGC
jgi:hypothetical protein